MDQFENFQVVGIKEVVQCHGSFARATCMKCRHKVEAEVIREDIFAQKIPLCPKCPKNPSAGSLGPADPMEAGPSGSSSSGDQNNDSAKNLPEMTPSIMKPDIVFFGEGLGKSRKSVMEVKVFVELTRKVLKYLKIKVLKCAHSRQTFKSNPFKCNIAKFKEFFQDLK